jgi:pyruvate formate lyase activating enzyme
MNPGVGAALAVMEQGVAGSHFTARYWHWLDDGRIQCDVCPRFCKLHEGQRGLCFVRARADDAMVLTTYGRSSGFCVDPIEKKPLNHFLPGTRSCRLAPQAATLPASSARIWTSRRRVKSTG